MRHLPSLWAAGLVASVHGLSSSCASTYVTSGVEGPVTSCRPGTSSPLQPPSREAYTKTSAAPNATPDPNGPASSVNYPPGAAQTPGRGNPERIPPGVPATPNVPGAPAGSASNSNPAAPTRSQVPSQPEQSQDTPTPQSPSLPAADPGPSESKPPNPRPSGPNGGTPSMTTKTRSANPSASTASTASASKQSNKYGDLVCLPDQWNKENWAKGGMDYFMKEYLKEEQIGKSAPMTLFMGTTDFMGYHCSYEDCHFDVESPDRCKKGANSHIFFALTAYNYLWNLIASALPDQLDQIADLTDSTLPKMADDFAPPDLGPKTDKLTDAFIIMSGVFGILSGVAAVAGGPEGGALSGIAAVGGGIATIGVGVQNLLSDATTAARAVEEHGEMSHRMSANAGWFVNDYRNGLKKYATALLEGPPDDKNLTKYTDIFKDGKFAEEIDQSYAENFGNNTKHTIYSSSLAYLWRSKSIFVAFGKKEINGKSPCDIDITQTDNEKEFYRVCDHDEDDTAYFFAAQPSDWGRYDSSFPAVPGADNLKDWELDRGALMKSARWAQKKSGFDKKYWSPEKAADAFKSKDPPPNGYLFNLPVCDLDSISDPDKYVSGSSGNYDNNETIWLRQKLAQCAHMEIGGEKWPYGDF